MGKLVSRRTYIVDAARTAVDAALNETAEFILTLVRLTAPVKTGALRDSYQIEAVGDLWLRIGTALLYAKFQELGFHHHVSGKFISNPHLVPAVYQAEGFLEAALLRHLGAIK